MAQFDRFANRFEEDQFWVDLEFMDWFDGKAILAQLRQGQKQWPLARDHLDRIAERHVQLDDFDDLKAVATHLDGLGSAR